MVGEAGRDDLVGAAALAGPEVLVALVVDPGGAADHHRGDDEGVPSEDRRVAVRGAPSPGARCEVAVVPHYRDRTPAAAGGNPGRLRKVGPHELPMCAPRARATLHGMQRDEKVLMPRSAPPAEIPTQGTPARSAEERAARAE